MTSESGTALSSGEPARNTSIDTILSAAAPRTSASSAASSLSNVPIAWAMPLGSMIMITEPSPRIVLPENIAMWRSLVDIGLTTISSV